MLPKFVICTSSQVNNHLGIVTLPQEGAGGEPLTAVPGEEGGRSAGEH